MSRIRQRELHARRSRKKKLAQLREQYAAAKSASAKTKILDKVSLIAPSLTKEDFEGSVKG
ncbi:hypothetical protein KJ652_07440 [Patescibacteria group bacterium]|nr:hypothetical protein [Patescibacteria group bacterium]MBU1124379.1 hypothetical protein [Patescibacteria group bacterium]MBU1911195.1 hypothetical protein [Patescibacteria group bacterium]